MGIFDKRKTVVDAHAARNMAVGNIATFGPLDQVELDRIACFYYIKVRRLRGSHEAVTVADDLLWLSSQIILEGRPISATQASLSRRLEEVSVLAV